MESLIDLKELKKHYPQLKLCKEKQNIIGNIHIECLCNDEYIKDNFEVKIHLFENSLPKVWELSNKIDNKYPHIYEDRRLCLATDLEQELYLKRHTIVEWISEFVEKYFISYVYYKRYGVFPFGEHSHGNEGIYEFVQRYYKMENLKETKNIYEYVCTKKYRGHLDCPCR